MSSSPTSYIIQPSPAALALFHSRLADALTGASTPALAAARGTASSPGTTAAVRDEIEALVAQYGEDCPLDLLLHDPLPYALASRVIPGCYRRSAFDVTLQEVLEADPRDLGAWLDSRCPGAGVLTDVRFRILGRAGDELRLEITGEIPSAPRSPDVENPMVPSGELPLGAGCDPPDEPRYCGYSAGGFTQLCPRCLAIHDAQQELLSTY